MSEIVRYSNQALSRSADRIAEIKRIEERAMKETAAIHESAVHIVKETLQRAAAIMPSEMSYGQLSEYKSETRRYLTTINSIGYTHCDRILSYVNEILSLPSGN